MEKEIRVIEVKRSIFENNDEDARRLRAELKEKKVFLLNLMSSPGSGKTNTLLALAKALEERVKIGLMEADIDSAVDAKTMMDAGIKSIQIHTGCMCHLDADMTRQGLYEFGKTASAEPIGGTSPKRSSDRIFGIGYAESNLLICSGT